MQDNFRIESFEKNKRDSTLISKLLDIWKASVCASHHFLTEPDIARLTPHAESALREIKTLWVVQDKLLPVGFMGGGRRENRNAISPSRLFQKGIGQRTRTTSI